MQMKVHLNGVYLTLKNHMNMFYLYSNDVYLTAI